MSLAKGFGFTHQSYIFLSQHKDGLPPMLCKYDEIVDKLPDRFKNCTAFNCHKSLMQHTIHIETIKSAVNCPLLNQGPFLAIQSFLMRQKKICLEMRLTSTYAGISGRYSGSTTFETFC